MEVTQTQPQTAAPTQSDASRSSEGPSVISSDFETFLRMLTVQMENQDPLNPIESQEFAVQLATFSGVEQQVRTNDLLASLAESLGGFAVSEFSAWIGREARAAAPAFFDGTTPVSVIAPASENASSAELVVRDPAGSVIDRRAIPTSGGEFEWSGISRQGNPFLEGLYSFSVESTDAEGNVSQEPAEVYDTITEARLTGDGDVELVLAGGGVVQPADVSGLRLPQESG